MLSSYHLEAHVRTWDFKHTYYIYRYNFIFYTYIYINPPCMHVIFFHPRILICSHGLQNYYYLLLFQQLYLQSNLQSIQRNRNLLGGSHCSDRPASTKMPRTSLTWPMQSLLTSCPLWLLFPQEWLQSVTALTAAVPGPFTSPLSHSTWMNIECLFTDLPSDLSFNQWQNFLHHSFSSNVLRCAFWELTPICLYKCIFLT